MNSMSDGKVIAPTSAFHISTPSPDANRACRPRCEAVHVPFGPIMNDRSSSLSSSRV
jgi:hypothetical protein